MKTIIPFLALGLAVTLPSYAEEAAAAEETKPAAEAPAAFTKKDKDSDGSLSKEEFTAGAKDAAKAEMAFTKKDKDGDGKISVEEFGGAKGKGEGKGEGKKKKKKDAE